MDMFDEPSAKQGSPYFYEQKFRNVIEDNLSLLIRDDNNFTTVSYAVAQNFKGNFEGLLRYISVPLSSRWIVMRVNGFTSSHQFDGRIDGVRHPDTEMLAKIFKTYRANR